MKKLRLKALSLGAKEILNRDQLKSISGGSGTPSPFPCAGDPANIWCCWCTYYPSIHWTCPDDGSTCKDGYNYHCNHTEGQCTWSSNWS